MVSPTEPTNPTESKSVDPATGWVSDKYLLVQIRLRKEREIALERLFQTKEKINNMPPETRTRSQRALLETVERWKPLFYGNPKMRDVWAPAPADVTDIINKTLEAVKTGAPLPRWGVQNGQPCWTTAEEIAMAKAMANQRKRIGEFMQKGYESASEFIRHKNEEYKYYARVLHNTDDKKRELCTMSRNVDKARPPVPKPSPVRAGEVGSIDVAEAMPPKRKAMSDVTPDNNKSKRLCVDDLGTEECMRLDF